MTERDVSAPLRSQWLDDRRIAVATLARPKANIIDAKMCAALSDALDAAIAEPKCRALILHHEGPHFSFGASVEEHRPEVCASMLTTFHAMILRFVASPLPILVACRGQCLGGGLELLLTAHLVFASSDASFGMPEIKLGVFAPAGSVLLPLRMRPAQACAMLLSGANVDAQQALSAGLIDAMELDPYEGALAYVRTHFLQKSASSLRFATRAARACYLQSIQQGLAQVETLYLGEDGVMKTHDAVEGIAAFLEKRPAQWKDR
jgi:cyclohexa-1,5-dienecarbonyl-CoA hydratase